MVSILIALLIGVAIERIYKQLVRIERTLAYVRRCIDHDIDAPMREAKRKYVARMLYETFDLDTAAMLFSAARYQGVV